MAKLPLHLVCQSRIWKPYAVTVPLTIHRFARTLARFTQYMIMLALLLLNTACSPFALYTQESHSHEFAETLLEDASWLDGHKRVVLHLGGIN